MEGALIYVDEQGRQTGYDDVHSKLRMAREHFKSNGVGEDYLRQLVR